MSVVTFCSTTGAVDVKGAQLQTPLADNELLVELLESRADAGGEHPQVLDSIAAAGLVGQAHVFEEILSLEEEEQQEESLVELQEQDPEQDPDEQQLAAVAFVERGVEEQPQPMMKYSKSW